MHWPAAPWPARTRAAPARAVAFAPSDAVGGEHLERLRSAAQISFDVRALAVLPREELVHQAGIERFARVVAETQPEQPDPREHQPARPFRPKLHKDTLGARHSKYPKLRFDGCD